MENNLSKKQTQMILRQIAEIKRVIDLTNTRTGENRCGADEVHKKALDNYLNTWVGIPLSKIESILGLNNFDGWTDMDLERV